MPPLFCRFSPDGQDRGPSLVIACGFPVFLPVFRIQEEDRFRYALIILCNPFEAGWRQGKIEVFRGEYRLRPLRCSGGRRKIYGGSVRTNERSADKAAYDEKQGYGAGQEWTALPFRAMPRVKRFTAWEHIYAEGAESCFGFMGQVEKLNSFLWRVQVNSGGRKRWRWLFSLR